MCAGYYKLTHKGNNLRSGSSLCVGSMVHYEHILAERQIEFMTDQLDTVGQQAIAYLGLKHAARERALPKSRTAIRYCANSIRATHRQEFASAEELLAQ